MRNRPPLGPYRRTMPRVLGQSQGGGRFLMGDVPVQGLLEIKVIHLKLECGP